MFTKKFFRTVLAIVLAASMLLSFCSCGSPEAKFEKAQKEEISKVLDAFFDSYSNVNASDPQSVDSQVKITLGTALQNSLKANTGVSFDWVKDISLKLNSSVTDSAVSTEANLKYSNNNLLSVSSIIDMASGNVYALFPQLADKYFILATDSASGSAPIEIWTQSLDSLPSEKDMRKLIDKYIDVVFDNLPEMEVTKGSLEIDGVSEDGKIYKINFKQSDILNICKKVFETAVNDKELEAVIVDYCSSLEEMGSAPAEEIYDSFKDELTENISSIDNLLEELTEDPVYATWTSYLNKKSEIIGNKIEIPEMEMEFFCGTAQAKADVRLDFYLTVYGEEYFRINGDLTEKKNKLTGELKVTYGGKSICFIGVENFDRNKWEDGYLNGSFSVSPSKDGMEFIRQMVPTEYATFISTCSLKFDVLSSKNNSNITISLMSGNELYFSMNIVSDINKGANVNIPGNSQTIEDIEEWAQTVDMEQLIKDVKNSGLPSEIVDMIVGYLEVIKPV